MHTGRLPQKYTSESHLDASQPPDRALSRRDWFAFLPLVAGIAGGGILGVAGAGWLRRGDDSSDSPADVSTGSVPIESVPLETGTIAWAQWIQRAPAVDLLAAAGELERVRMRIPDPQLVPVFRRLLACAMENDLPEADPAGRIAVRSLYRLGATLELELAGEQWLGRHARVPFERQETTRELRRALQDMKEKRR